ncbi:hypothetical protein [Kibdelosporangium aridum]|uniref:Uncharacterized protein n=1 Tax=Kibdelosporangium aridum TaxID=2030 RepID=A0A1Y5XLL2_KIBAR|nr:hypothetical protein [Kibdelosporangium aridum]SMD05135.1 hypothetical protein SAMN05661093_03916 [Kibdelosporangium aridum]
MAVVALVASACGSEPSVSADDLFGEYLQSTSVKNDRFPTRGSSAEARRIALASRYTVDELQGELLRTFECDEVLDSWPLNKCELNNAVTAAARDFGGVYTLLLGRSVLVKYENGSLELMTLYVMQAPGTRVGIVDRTGRTYSDLEDFRATNELLTSDDTMLTLRDITSVPGKGEIVAVTGHTSPTWPWWLLGGIVVLAVVGAGFVVVQRRSTKRP